MAVHVFGIRHHGPGSAKSLLAALRQLSPDLVLVEGPVEADDQIHWVSHEAVQPPVALLIFRPDEPASSVFYPFAGFSPEWNALRFAAAHGIPARFMDLPKSNWMALPPEEVKRSNTGDPLEALARLSGEADSETWWDRLVESRGDAETFAAVHEAMSALRDGHPGEPIDDLREAAMRQQIRAAGKEGFERIAVVCGAWHGPALIDGLTAKQDAALLKGLPKVKVQATWIPWTHGRLLRASGYGAGVESPGWYEHLWLTPDQTAESWVSKVAQLLRTKDLDASPAQVVDAVVLANALASFRERRHPGLRELNEATEAALLFGNPVPLRLITEKLIVGEVMGEVPAEASVVPIQRDLENLQKRLRLKPELYPRKLELDLRKPGDRERSQLLHRLRILGIDWGEEEDGDGRQGTFHETWQLRWSPEYPLELIAAAPWGNTVEAAAAAKARDLAATAKALSGLTAMLEPVLKANLPEAAPDLLKRVRDMAAVAPDIADLMEAIPPLVRIARYGDVRRTDQETVQQAITELNARVCVGFPPACASLDDDAARAMVHRMNSFHQAVQLLEENRPPWRDALHRVVSSTQVHGLVTGRACRLLHDANELSAEEVSARGAQKLSAGTEPAMGAAWIEGFLANSGHVLLLNDALWEMVDRWMVELQPEQFRHTLPLVRRTFSTFAPAERRQLGERAREAGAPKRDLPGGHPVDHARAAAALPLLRKILGLEDADAV